MTAAVESYADFLAAKAQLAGDWSDGPVRVLVGDVRARLAELPAASVHCVVTSPPYWGLRDYGTLPGIWGGQSDCAHQWGGEVHLGDPNRGNQGSTLSGSTRNQESANRWRSGSAFCVRCGAWRGSFGLEPTPDLYVEHLVQVFRAVRRVLRPDGTLWLNLGDSYAGDRGRADNGDREVNGKTISRRRDNAPVPRSDMRVEGLKPKDLVGVPWMVAFALRADGWWLRRDNVWAKPNPMPESVTDRPTTAHEYVFLLTLSERYFYDAEAVREPMEMRPQRRLTCGGIRRDAPGQTHQNGERALRDEVAQDGNPAGRNLRSVWTIATQPYPEAHFATFPEELARRCIAAGTSERGCCPVCGVPWRRVVKRERAPRNGEVLRNARDGGLTAQDGLERTGLSHFKYNEWLSAHPPQTTGWEPSCRCAAGEPVPCTVLDPFAGSGTTLAVARRMGRRAVGVELQPDYLPLIRRRVADAARPLFEKPAPVASNGHQQVDLEDLIAAGSAT